MEFERHRRWNIFSLILVVTLLSLVMLPAVNSQENETNFPLPYIDPLIWQELNQHGWARSLVTVNNSSSVGVVMSSLPAVSFQLIEETPPNSSFTANISWQAFDILANDTNVTSIYLQIENQDNQSIFSFSVYKEGIAYITQAGVLIDAKIIDAFYLNNWSHIDNVGLKIRAPENLTSSYIRTFPMSQRGPLFSIRDAYYTKTGQDIAANLSSEEFNITEISTDVLFGSITKKGVEKLGSDPRIEFIAIPLVGTGVATEELNESDQETENTSLFTLPVNETEQKNTKLELPSSVILPLLLVLGVVTAIIVLLVIKRNPQLKK